MVYSFAKPAPPPSPSCTNSTCYLELGCFADPYCTNGHTKTAMTVLQPKEICFKTIFAGKICFPISPVTSISGCADLASSAYNYRYFTFKSGTCYGSNSTAYAVSNGPSSACTSTCPSYSGGPMVPCGGTCANTIYQVSGKRNGLCKGWR